MTSVQKYVYMYKCIILLLPINIEPPLVCPVKLVCAVNNSLLNKPILKKMFLAICFW